MEEGQNGVAEETVPTKEPVVGEGESTHDLAGASAESQGGLGAAEDAERPVVSPDAVESAPAPVEA
ncbi:MAG: hypothetical protein Q7U76_12820 [Nitrospirota bacterium]|nr:hypothetical protein [Nitrospirota bacterium]